ncbi:uncharacterized protein CIMG_13591 [Coccidioides immitis RS]|uniref:DNA (cytosine-5)-methyltransferase 1 replication foci domain-containing protein n=1 Tax=Coccidioides immitis (strain RS) TaxID=246410 RepID=J3K1Y1_COCIM|nr:uncharacterized protein CIMG_13591 [Coccidioides immitis RS]EAS28050.3 hypothetical protein CIMG_13591 [Coccidioides immitis RS]
MTARIESILAARSPSLTDENDWEEFTLSDVKVRVPGKVRYANLLYASPENPVSVTGQLELVEEHQKPLVLDENYRAKRVIIENVTHFAYGQHDDGEVGIWVAGKPGWFSVSPAKGYKAVFNEMVEAVDLLYFITDKHQPKGRKRKQWNPKLDYLLDQYIKHTHEACEDADDAAEVFDKHHAFLMKQMFQGREGIDWDTTPIYKYFRDKYKELFQELENESAKEGPINITGDEEVEDDNTESPDAVTVERTQADTVFEAILDMRKSKQGLKPQLTLKTVAEYLLKRFEMVSLDYAIDLMKARASYLIEMMDNARNSSSVDWSRKTIYKQLKKAERSASTQDVCNTPLHPRPPEDQENSSSSPEESDEEELPRQRRARMSILRPKLSSVPMKRAGKSAKQPPSEASDSEELEDMNLIEDTPTRPGGHHMTQEPLPPRVNELARSVISISDLETSSPHARSVQEAVEPPGKTGPFINGNSTMPSPALAPPDVNHPPDTWICSVHGCGKAVYKASSKRSKEVILDHSLVHANDTQTKLNLVFAEQRLNVNASVDHLLNRIRDFGSLQEDAGDGEIDSGSKKIKVHE